MNRIVSILIIVCLFSCVEKPSCNFIDSYYQDVYQAELAFYEEDYQNAYNLFKEVEARCGLLNQTLIREPEMMAKLSIKVGEPQKAFPYMERMLKEGMSFDTFKNNEIYNILKEYEEWDYLARNAASYADEFNANINQDLRAEIIAMNRLDQEVRQPPIDFIEMERVDSIHQKRIKAIFKEHGYPSAQLVGKDNFDQGERVGVKTLFFHFDDTIYFKPVLLKMIEDGEAPADILGKMIDSRQRSRGFYDYGIYDNVDSTNILDFKNIDKRRIAVGLAPWKLKKRVDSLRRVYYDY
ncbi:hypothetical protein JM84_0650 [Dokdonia sp. Hel_I_63]|uniref:hypothetical protein n=1 Tax=Dokdonia sp. Hel_I_63 TaxID=1249996 RepID=UPI00119B3E0A|nr:hypothetical protein [Dokdonia sp. Hel_I_63]TVZ21772.1 hypothetical protein JM84_0650 [Dokdonia sp. Hel_I_63]